MGKHADAQRSRLSATIVFKKDFYEGLFHSTIMSVFIYINRARHIKKNDVCFLGELVL